MFVLVVVFQQSMMYEFEDKAWQSEAPEIADLAKKT
jgi:hypothetical protein